MIRIHIKAAWSMISVHNLFESEEWIASRYKKPVAV
jgi:hypothetical protein